MQGESPDIKAYWQQFESRKIISGVMYREVELLNMPEPVHQLFLPKLLRDEFLALVHGGIAGHLGAAKT